MFSKLVELVGEIMDGGLLCLGGLRRFLVEGRLYVEEFEGGSRELKNVNSELTIF